MSNIVFLDWARQARWSHQAHWCSLRHPHPEGALCWFGTFFSCIIGIKTYCSFNTEWVQRPPRIVRHHIKAVEPGQGAHDCHAPPASRRRDCRGGRHRPSRRIHSPNGYEMTMMHVGIYSLTLLDRIRSVRPPGPAVGRVGKIGVMLFWLGFDFNCFTNQSQTYLME